MNAYRHNQEQQMSKHTGRIENWRLHTIGKHTVVLGTVFEDTKGRWPDGFYIRTSSITKVQGGYKEGSTVTTMNSTYLLGRKKAEET